MSVWKKLNKQDSFITTYVAKKRWNLTSGNLNSAGVKLLPAYSEYSNEVLGNRKIGSNCNLVAEAEYLGATCLLLAEGVYLDTCHILLEAEQVVEI